MTIKQKIPVKLMNAHAEILAELNSRNVVRTYNSTVGDYAEWLVTETLGFVLEYNSQRVTMRMIPNRFALSGEKPVGVRHSVGAK